jgi:hypothetical protein
MIEKCVAVQNKHGKPMLSNESIPGCLDDARRAELARWSIAALVRDNRIETAGEQLLLTDLGRTDARKLVRSHRLWETYLVQNLGMPLDHVHEPAHRVEHFIGEQLQQDLEAELDASGQDPHGRQIPE